MSAEDHRKLREFWATPAGRDMLARINRAYTVQPMPEDSWRPSPIGSLPFPSDTEAANPVPPSDSRTFRPVYLAHRTSWWPLIIATIVATSACAILIGWFVSKALERHA